jgi:hypothetical protein
VLQGELARETMHLLVAYKTTRIARYQTLIEDLDGPGRFRIELGLLGNRDSAGTGARVLPLPDVVLPSGH